jgi:hypothetical protein
MKKIILIEANELNKILDKVKLKDAPMEDVKNMLRLSREVESAATEWNNAIKDAMQKLDLKEGDTMTLQEIDKYLSEVLQDEMKREVEITPFVLSAEAEDVILAQSDITRGQIRIIKEVAKPIEEKNNN